MHLQTNSGVQIDLVRLHSQSSYLGIMLGETKVVNDYLLEDIKSQFSPESWQNHHRFIPQMAQLRKNVSDPFPAVACAGLFLVSGGAREMNYISFVVIWFQETFFGNTPASVVQAIKEYNVNALENSSYH